MTNAIFDNAARLREVFAAQGQSVRELSISTNRHGEHSAHFAIGGGLRVRVSDHSCNTDFRIGEIGVSQDANDADVAAILATIERNTVEDRLARSEQDRRQDERDAPFAARFRAAAQHQQHDIIIEAYPASANDKAMRRTIAVRWSRG